MPPSLAPIRDLLTAYLDRNPGERSGLAALLAALDTATDATSATGDPTPTSATGDPTSRTTLPGHITCSAAVIDPDARVLHVLHRGTGLLLAPGGHVDATDETLLAACLRELKEEVGIPAAALALTPAFREGPIDIDVHTIDADPAKGEPAHRHYDFRFVFQLTADDVPGLTLQAEEVDGATWLPFDKVSSSTLRAKLVASGLDGTIRPVNASALIHDGSGRYLLHLRDANKPDIWEPGAWSLLGGGSEPQDRGLLDTMRRELMEEAGLAIEDLRPYAVELATGTAGTRVPIQLFTGRWSGDPSTLPLTEGVMLAWVHPEKFPFMTMPPSTRTLLERHAAERPAPVPEPARTLAPARSTWPGAVASATAPPGTVPHILGVHLYLERDGQVLLGHRHPDSAFAGGLLHTLAGHCEAESATACLVREAHEEAGLVIDPADLALVHTVHLVGPGRAPRIQLFFRAGHWEGVPEIREPDKCVGWGWWNAKDLPEPIVPYTRAAIEGIQAGRPYTELGWAR
ncbi:NUDIX domain-containing protein [Streptomyces sp. NPDC056361]|uniref:NUDIX domain-containing protein n=1 Tax=Streptomyces sp. NPDC056361 TaxID=3345795 RepID=UPI0035D8586E